MITNQGHKPSTAWNLYICTSKKGSSLKNWGRLVLTAGSHDGVSRSSTETQLVNLMFQPFKWRE